MNRVSYEELARDRQFGGEGNAVKSKLDGAMTNAFGFNGQTATIITRNFRETYHD